MRRAWRVGSIAVLLALLLGSVDVVNAGSPVGGGFLIQDDTAVAEAGPAVAYNSQAWEYLVVWEAELAGPTYEVWGRRVAPDGRSLGPAFRISPASEGRHPDVAYSSAADEYMVVWQNGMDVRAQRVTPAGTLEGGVIDVALGSVAGQLHYEHPVITYAATADRYLVAYRYVSDAEDETVDIRARSLLSDGSPEAAEFVLVSYNRGQAPDNPAVAYNPSRDECLVVWQEAYTPSDHDLYGRRVQMTGGAAPADSTFSITMHMTDETMPDVAALPTVDGEGTYLVTWQDGQDIWVRRILWDGSIDWTQAIAETGWGEYRPAVAGRANTQEFLVVWTWVPVSTPPAQMEVQGMIVGLDGLPVGSLTDLGGKQVFDVAITAGPTADYLVVYDDNEVFGTLSRGIYGQLWGLRTYVPLVMRN